MKLLNETLARIERRPSVDIESAVRARWDSLTKPRGSLGILEECVLQLARIQDVVRPQIDRQAVYVFCGDHGVTQEGVSPYLSVVTREMAKNFVRGGAAINVLCRSAGIETRIVDAGMQGPKVQGVMDCRVANGTNNFAKQAAMDERQAVQAIEAGIQLAIEASSQFDLVGMGEMGIGNSASASALLCALTNISAEQAVGRGAGLDDAGLRHKIQVIAGAITLHRLRCSTPISALAAVGGLEIAMMAGFFLGAASKRLAVVVDGFISSTAFLLADKLFPKLTEFAFFAHQSAEPGHGYLLSSIGASPLLNLQMRLGEGTGAVLGMNLLSAAVHLYNGMTTFSEAAISDIA